MLPALVRAGGRRALSFPHAGSPRLAVLPTTTRKRQLASSSSSASASVKTTVAAVPPVWKEVKEACNRQDFDQAFKLLLQHNGQGRDCAYVVKQCVLSQRVDVLERVVFEALDRRSSVPAKERKAAVPPGLRLGAVMNQVFKTHLKSGRFELAWRLYQQVMEPAPPDDKTTPPPLLSPKALLRNSQQQQLRPSEKTYRIMLEGCYRAGKSKEAMALVKEAGRRGVELSELSLQWALQTCARGLETRNARHILQAMEARKLAVSPQCFQELLKAQVKLGEPCEALLRAMAAQGLQVSVHDHAVAGQAAQALALWDALPVGERTELDYTGALTAASDVRDARRVVGLLEALEAAKDVPVTTAKLVLACRLFRDDADSSTEKEEEEESTSAADRTRCLDTIVRLAHANGVFFLEENLAKALRQDGREADARRLSEAWMGQRLGNHEQSLRHQALGYAGMIAAQGRLRQWPVAHYLYDEVVFRLGRHQMLRALMRALQLEEEEEAAQAAAAAAARAAIHDVALRLYRHAAQDGLVNHWSKQRPGTMDVHRFPTYWATLAVEMVLHERATEGGKGAEDLWIITGGGKHNPVPHPKTKKGEEGGGQGDTTQEERACSAAASPQGHHMTLRNKLAHALAQGHNLFSPAELEQLEASHDASKGRLRVRKQAVQAWLDKTATTSKHPRAAAVQSTPQT